MFGIQELFYLKKNCISLHQFYYYYLTLLFDLCLDLKRKAESLTLP